METPDWLFYTYSIALAVSGLIMLVIAAIGFGQGVGARALNGIAGVGFLGYSIYLLFFFEGGDYIAFWYAFALPLIMIVQAVKAKMGNKETVDADA